MDQDSTLRIATTRHFQRFCFTETIVLLSTNNELWQNRFQGGLGRIGVQPRSRTHFFCPSPLKIPTIHPVMRVARRPQHSCHFLFGLGCLGNAYHVLALAVSKGSVWIGGLKRILRMTKTACSRNVLSAIGRCRLQLQCRLAVCRVIAPFF
jgi:hypothetical protein